jgi:hypothetical protein
MKFSKQVLKVPAKVLKVPIFFSSKSKKESTFSICRKSRKVPNVKQAND